MNFKDPLVTLYNKDCRNMAELPNESVQCCVTSPPYWGLRKYAGEQELVWGGKEDCQHIWQMEKISLLHENRNFHTGTQEEVLSSGYNLAHTHKQSQLKAGFCSLCGAWRGAFGLEPSPELYVQHTVEILREIRRVLRSDGVVFWNIGDSYAANRSYQVPDSKWVDVGNAKASKVPEGLKPKDLCLIPFRVAIAAQADGWWVRSIIIWSKPNPMPESVRDRPTESHEYILMLTKSSRYFWDMEAVREGDQIYTRKAGLDARKANEIPNGDYKGIRGFGKYDTTTVGRNIRSVWTFPTQPYKGAHFAVFPEELPERCIKAATSEYGVCAKCGAPWERIVEHKPMVIRKTEGYAEASGNRTATAGTMVEPAESKTIGWQSACECGAPAMPSLILDPFAGSGTTLAVAKRLGRRAVGYEISEPYCRLAQKRIEAETAPLAVQEK